MRSYTNVFIEQGKVYHFYIEDGVRKTEITDFKPVYGTLNNSIKSKWKNIYGDNIELRIFNSISEAKKWRHENKEYIDIYGDISLEYQFLNFKYPNKVIPQKKAMNIFNIDIEVNSQFGFPDIEEANDKVTAITVADMVRNKYYSFAYKEDYTPKDESVTFYKCVNEVDMLYKFVDFIQKNPVDIWTGWNISGFDMIYLVNRIKKVLDWNTVLKLSPVKKVKTTKFLTMANKEIDSYIFLGSHILDYIDLYKKYTFEPRERYTLDHIAEIEIGQNKVEYSSEHVNLHELYNNNFELYMDYNIHDVRLVNNIDTKRKLIDLAISIAYEAHCNFGDVFGTVKPWDSKLYNKLLHGNVMIPPSKSHTKQQFPGGWVFCKTTNMYKSISSFDISSSYPNQIRTFNISPETIIDYQQLSPELKEFKAKYGDIDRACLVKTVTNEDKEILKKHNVTFTSNGQFFKKDTYGFLPKIMTEIYLDRKQKKEKTKELDSLIKTKEQELKKLKDLLQNV